MLLMRDSKPGRRTIIGLQRQCLARVADARVIDGAGPAQGLALRFDALPGANCEARRTVGKLRHIGWVQA